MVGLEDSIYVVDESRGKPNLMTSSMHSTLCTGDETFDFAAYKGNNNITQAKGVVQSNFNVIVDCLSFDHGPSSKWA